MSTKAKHAIAPAIRSAFLNALEQIKYEEGLTFSEIIAMWIKSDNYSNIGQVLTAISKFDVQQKQVKHDHTGSITLNAAIQETTDWLERVTESGESEPLEEPGEIRPLLLTSVSDEQTGSGEPVAIRQMQGSAGKS